MPTLPVVSDDVFRFAERVLLLIDSGRKSATYKLATLLALIDVVAESTDQHATAPDSVSGTAVARRVIELYWPQSAMYTTGPGDRPQALRQSPQNDIPAKLHHWRCQHGIGERASLDVARAADPVGFAALERDLIATVIRMPIPKLQRFGENRGAVEDRFMFDFSWRDEEGARRIFTADFDDRLYLQPHVGEYLVRLAPLLRPAIQHKWAELVARRNTDLVDDHQLSEFLFGAERVDLSPVRGGLAEVQNHECFYCGHRMQSKVQVDHFIPWSRQPDNSLANLVAAHPACNANKSASIAGHEHLERWTQRLAHDVLSPLADESGWTHRPMRTLSLVRATYLWLPEHTQLWVLGNNFEPIDPLRIQELFTTTA